MSQTWTLVNSNMPAAFSLIGCYRNGQPTITNGQAIIGVGYTTDSIIYYSSNGGNTFNTTTTFPYYVVDPTNAFTYVNSSNIIVYLVDASNNIYVSRNGGQTFTFYLSITGLIGYVNCITCNVSGNNIIVGSYSMVQTSITSYLYVYSNSTWYNITISNVSTNSRSLICSSSGQYIYSLYQSSLGIGFIVISSSNYGNSFNLSGYTLPNGTRDTYSCLACSADGSIVYAVSNYGIYKSTDYASSWSVITNISGDFTYVKTDSVGKNVIIASSLNNSVYYTNNGGSTWSYYNNINQPRITISSDGLTMYAYSSLNTSLYQFQYPAPIICFHESAKILTNLGYLPIRDLRKGDLIQTADHGFVPIEIIGRREISHPANTQDRIKDQLYLCSRSKYSNTPIFEDLILTGCHSILVKQFESNEQRDQTEKLLGDIYITDNHYRLPACLDDRADVYDKPGNYMIYHFALENRDYYMNYGVYANGLLVETSSLRFMYELSNMDLLCD